MRKVVLSVLSLISAFALAGCSQKDQNGGNGTQTDQYDTVLADTQSACWAIHGNVNLSDGSANGWGDKSKELYEKSKMTAISINQAVAIDSTVGAKLKEKNVEYLYKYEGLQLGRVDAGWKAKYESGNDLYQTNGSYVFKAVQCSYDADDEVYSVTQWIPDPRTAHVEALTNNLYVPPFKEEANANGLSWSSNQVVTSGAGIYTVICAKYKEVSSETVAGYGYAIIKTGEAGEDWVKPAAEKVEPFIAASHTYGVIGDFNTWATDVAMTANAGKTEWTADVTTTAANQAAKVRVDGAWDLSWGLEAVKDDASKALIDTTADSGNIVLKEAGTYTFTLKDVTVDREATITIAKKAA